MQREDSETAHRRRAYREWRSGPPPGPASLPSRPGLPGRPVSSARGRPLACSAPDAGFLDPRLLLSGAPGLLSDGSPPDGAPPDEGAPVGGAPITGCDGSLTFGQRLVREGRLKATVINPPASGVAIEWIARARKNGEIPPVRVLLPVTSFPALPSLKP